MVELTNIRNLLLVGVISLCVGGVIGKSMTKPEVVTVTKTETVEVEKKDVTTHKHETIKPDGTKVIDTTTTDKSTEDTTIDQSSKTTSSSARPQWFVTGGMGLDASTLKPLIIPIYQVSVNKRLLGPVYIGVWGTSRAQAGLQVGLEF